MAQPTHYLDDAQVFRPGQRNDDLIYLLVTHVVDQLLAVPQEVHASSCLASALHAVIEATVYQYPGWPASHGVRYEASAVFAAAVDDDLPRHSAFLDQSGRDPASD